MKSKSPDDKIVIQSDVEHFRSLVLRKSSDFRKGKSTCKIEGKSNHFTSSPPLYSNTVLTFPRERRDTQKVSNQSWGVTGLTVNGSPPPCYLQLTQAITGQTANRTGSGSPNRENQTVVEATYKHVARFHRLTTLDVARALLQKPLLNNRTATTNTKYEVDLPRCAT